MGSLQECTVNRRDGTARYKGHAWVAGDGMFDAIWVENGKTERGSFDPNGNPLGFWNKYSLSLD